MTRDPKSPKNNDLRLFTKFWLMGVQLWIINTARQGEILSLYWNRNTELFSYYIL